MKLRIFTGLGFCIGLVDRRTIRIRDVYVTQPRMKFSCAEYKYVCECVIGGITSDVVIWVETEMPTLEHEGGEIAHDWLSLEVEIAEHFIRAPPTQQSDDICVNITTKESHSARGAKGVGRNVLWEETELGAKYCCSQTHDVVLCFLMDQC